MFFGPNDSTEEDYYIKNDFSPEEIKQGLAAPVQKFCNNAHMVRPALQANWLGIRVISILRGSRERASCEARPSRRARKNVLLPRGLFRVIAEVQRVLRRPDTVAGADCRERL